LKPDEELVGTINSANGDVDIVIQRVDRKNSGRVWLFSGRTLDSIPRLYDENSLASADGVLVDGVLVLPEFLVNTRFLSIALFQWLAVFVGMPLLYFLTVVLSRLLSPLAGAVRRRLYRKTDLPNPESLPRPIRLLLLAFLIRWAAARVTLPLLARQFWSSTTSIMIIAASVWLLIEFVSWGEEHIKGRLKVRNLAAATSMLRLASRVTDLLIIFVGVPVALYHFGVNPTAGLAGLGVGGIAVALAAQKTLENVIGGVSIILDGTVNVGDVIKVGDTHGTVENIGLRSTRIRTPDRTVVSVPNGQMAHMTLENLSSRDKFWFHPILALRYETTPPQMYTVLDRIRSLLEESRHLEPHSFGVRFLGFAATIRKAEKLIESFEQCKAEAEIPFDNILDRVTGSDPSVTNYVLKQPAKCPNCRREIFEKTLVEPAA
jgi:MscS family membrane protein